MAPRDPHQPDRVASSLELFFDLVFVVAVSTAAGQLHHALRSGHVVDGVTSYLLIFFGIWWAWMNFTWFATSFDTDDWLYRVTTFVQMAGVLVLAAGIEPAFSGHDYRIVVAGYVVMRVAMCSQWLRAARQTSSLRRTALTYAWMIALVQCLWVAWIWIPESLQLPGFILLVVLELTVPLAAERGDPTPWHPHHITERYSLFTLILLGESLLASSHAIYSALHSGTDLAPLLSLALLALVVTACLWWIYFWPPHHRVIGSLRQSIRYGYGHYAIFAAAGAFSAGIELEVDRIDDRSALGEVAASFTVTLPIAIFLLGVWLLAIRAQAPRVINVVVPWGALLVLCDPLVPLPIAWTALVLVLVVAVLVRHSVPSGASDAHAEPSESRS